MTRGQSIEVEAVILAYESQVMRDHFADGSFVSYDATVVRVTGPAPWRDHTCTVFHDRPPSPGSLWRAVGTQVRFVIDDADLRGGDQLFTAAVSDLRERQMGDER